MATKPPTEGDYDVVIIGGGINGCGIARDAAGRGYSVFLAEMNDLASATSSASTKLIHGGLRYLEHLHLRLVREALIEREVLWANAPHIVRPLRFILPHHVGLRPRWMLRVGLFIYDHLGGRRRLPPTKTLDLAHDPVGAALKPGFSTAFEYSDCWVDDARLVVLNARDAADRGAVIRTRCEVTGIERIGGRWRVAARDRATGRDFAVTARLVVNAAGPWVDRVPGAEDAAPSGGRVRLVQGSHIVVPKLFDDPRCFMFQNADGRVVFAIPYEDDYTLIGTTDRDFEGDPSDVRISAEEIAYLCDAASGYFARPVTPHDIVWTYSGVRPLYDDGTSRAQEATRDYVLKQSGDLEGDTLITVLGGKITTYRRLAETVLAMVQRVLGRRGAPWTAGAPLPGGDFDLERVEHEIHALTHDFPFLAAHHARRLVRAYGTRARHALGRASRVEELGRLFGADLFETELRYLVEHEWAMSSDDILWRRSKRGLAIGPAEAAEIQAFVSSLLARGGASADGARS